MYFHHLHKDSSLESVYETLGSDETYIYTSFIDGSGKI